MKLLNNRIKKYCNKKSKASLAGTIIIFMTAFLIFCICATDVGKAVTSRYKAQKITETIALYMASYLNSLPDSERNAESLNSIKESFETLYSDYNINRNYRFEIVETEIKTGSMLPVKVKVTTKTSIPTLFLRYAGIGVINVVQTSYASTYSFNLAETDSDAKSYTYMADEIITDKSGADIEISYNRPYIIFAGLKNGNAEDNIKWIEIGSMSDDNDKTHFVISNADESYDVQCISKEDVKYDFSSDINKTLGLIQYVKIIKTDTCSVDGALEAFAESEKKPVVSALNSVKIINRQTFLNE